jgi:hypothetical protein
VNDAALDGGGHGFGAVFHLKFAEDALQMVFDGVLGNVEMFADLFVGQIL